MLERFERPVKIICLAMAAWLAWQLGGLILHGNPLAHLKIPALPTLPGATNGPDKVASKETNAPSGTNVARGTNAAGSTNAATSTNAVHVTNAIAKSTNAPTPGGTGPTNTAGGPMRGGSRGAGPPPGMTPEMMAMMPGGGMGGGMKKTPLPPDVQARVNKILDSEIFGPVVRPMPLALTGIAEDQAFIQATNGQTGPVKVGGEMGGVKLLRIGINRVLVEQDGEKKELTLFGGVGGESLMPKSTNAPIKMASIGNATTNLIISPKRKESQ